jgi:dihydrofolate reductase
MIAAVSPEGVIGLNGAIPWRHPGDMRRFARVTRGGTVIMGRLTWESMKRRPLPHRRNIVITRGDVGDVEHYADVGTALAKTEAGGAARTETGEVWFIGGARIYEEAMAYCDVIDLTYVPEHVTDPAAVKFPPIDDAVWEAGELIAHEEEPGLTRRVFRRRTSAPARRTCTAV